MLSTNLVLIRCITVTYLNRLLDNPLLSVNHTVDEAIDLCVPKNTMIGDASEGEVIDALKNTLTWIKQSDKEVKIEPKDIDSTIKINVGFDSDYANVVADHITKDLESQDEKKIKERIRAILSELNSYLKKKRNAKKLASARSQIEKLDSQEEINTFLKQLSEDIKADSAETDDRPVGFVGEMDTENPETVEQVMKRTKELNTDEGSLRIPLEGLYEAIGKVNVRRGDLAVFKARTNQYKSGMLLNLTEWLPVYNKPHILSKDKKKKPLIFRASFENTPEQDALTMYKSIAERELGEKIDIGKIDPKEASKYLINKLKANGFHVVVACFNPNMFDAWKLIDLLMYYELNGYEVVACICDYLEIILKSMPGQRADSAITNGFEIVRNHCMPKRIAFLTGHQLNTASGDLLAEVGSAAFPKKIAQAGGIYDYNCRSLTQKVDMEINMHIHKQDDVSYLGFGVGKLRERLAPESKKYFFYKFHEFGGIHPDEDGENNAIYSLSSMGSEGEDSKVEW